MYVIIAGAGIVGSQVARELSSRKHDVVVIDKDIEVCEAIYAETGAMTVNGDATRIKTLLEAGIEKADSILCLMRNDADNIACALLSKSLGLEDIIARLRQPQYEQAYRISGVTNLVNMSRLLVDRIIMAVEKPNVRKIFTIEAGKADIFAVNIKENSRVIGMTIREIAQNKSFPDECVFMGIYDKNKENFYIPRGNHVLKSQDTVFIISKSDYIDQATRYLTRRRRTFRGRNRTGNNPGKADKE